MKKYILIALLAVVATAGACKKEDIKSKCATVKSKHSEYYASYSRERFFYFILSNNDRIDVDEKTYNQWAEGAIYTPRCVE